MWCQAIAYNVCRERWWDLWVHWRSKLVWLRAYILTHWGQVMHICVSKLTSIGSDDGLSPGRHQAIIWTNAGILLIGPQGTNFIESQAFSFTKIHFKISSWKWRPFCLSLNVFTVSNPCYNCSLVPPTEPICCPKLYSHDTFHDNW